MICSMSCCLNSAAISARSLAPEFSCALTAEEKQRAPTQIGLTKAEIPGASPSFFPILLLKGEDPRRRKPIRGVGNFFDLHASSGDYHALMLKAGIVGLPNV